MGTTIPIQSRKLKDTLPAHGHRQRCDGTAARARISSSILLLLLLLLLLIDQKHLSAQVMG